ncbi:dUTP diphosphatase [Adlercreutzia murintestinalis]|uniref:dUTP diphosphatase n=1 Tax=Adlercreutzia murintestinalis TaxID=2941325 RepID=UPI00203D9BF0|nr:dUTP diphosphatase [Adlercreutzia murintestinalis]
MTSSITVPIKRLRDDIALPAYAHAGDAGLDLRAAETCLLEPHGRAIVPCGFSLAIPEGYAGLVLPRSGLASKHGITLPNSPGLIDSGYRGEMMVSLQNTDAHEAFLVERGMRIAQLVIMPVPLVALTVVDQLDETDRGHGGFGSSGIE